MVSIRAPRAGRDRNILNVALTALISFFALTPHITPALAHSYIKAA
jgi:hypothetical protein